MNTIIELPIVLNKEVNDNARLIVFNYRNVTEEELRPYTRLNPEEEAIISKFTNTNRRKEWVAIRYFLQNVLEYKDCNIVYNESGAPKLQNPDLNISLSHSSGLAAIILSDSFKLGVDIEVKSNKALRTQSKYLSEAEMGFLDKKNRGTHALVCWSAKESAYKLLDRKGVQFIDNMRVKPFRLNNEGIVTVKLFYEDGLREYNINYERDAEYVLTYAVE